MAWLAFSNYRHLNIAREILGEIVTSPLELPYWSGSPYWLGSAETASGHAVKYSLVPGFEETGLPQDPRRMVDDYLHQALERHLKTREAVFEFRVQPQTDPVAMPVEDVSVVWDEAVSRPIPVATLTIGMQDVDSPEGLALAEECETMAFSPWNALAEHRPMGGINRLRQAVYLASQEKRSAKAKQHCAVTSIRGRSRMDQVTVGKYLAQRLEEVGVRDYFAIPGDFNLSLLDELLKNPRLKMVNCCNELNAGYAADGYNTLQNWVYAAMVETLKGKSPVLSQVVRTEKELVAALKNSKTFKGLTFIEVILDRTDCNKALLGWGTAVADYNAGKGKTAH